MSYNAKISAIEANSNHRSLCWHFFEKRNKKNICKICKKRICTKYGVTSNLRSHLQRKHEKIWNACLKNHVNKDISTTNDHMDEDNKDNISDEIAKTMLYYSRISEAYKSSSRESVIDSKPMCKIQPLQKVPINTKHSEPAIIYIKSEGSDEEIEPPHQKETTIELSNTAKPQHLQANSSFVKKYISNKRSRPTSFLRNKSRAPTTVRPGSSVSRTSINSVSRDESCDDLGTYIASRLKRRKAGQLQLEINGRLSLNKNNSSSSETTVFPVSGSVTCMDKNGQTYYIFPVSAESLQSSDIKIDSFETIPTIIEAESVQTVCITEDELFHMPVVETEPIQSMTVVEAEAVQNISVTEAGPVQNISHTEVETIQNIPATETKPVLKSSVKESNSVIGNVPSIELNCEDASVPEETGTSKSSTPIIQTCHAYSKSNSPKKSVTYSTNPTCERLSIDGKTNLNRASHFEPVHTVKSNSNNRSDPSHCFAEYLASMLRKIPDKHCIQLQSQIISMICKEYSKYL